MGTIEIIELLIDAIGRGAALVQKLRAAAQQSGELSDEQSAALDAKLAAAFASDAWRPDGQ
jgi:hypothetical protein